ncbi:MAG: hypothetical protein AABW41_01970 [Nanoarchaeota archaeon]
MLEDKLDCQLELFEAPDVSRKTNLLIVPSMKPYLLAQEGVRDYLKELFSINNKDYSFLDNKSERVLLGIFYDKMEALKIEPPYNCQIPGRTFVPYTRYRKKGRRKDLESYVRHFHEANEFKLPLNFSKMSARALTQIYFTMIRRYNIEPRRDFSIVTENDRQLDLRVIVNRYR